MIKRLCLTLLLIGVLISARPLHARAQSQPWTFEANVFVTNAVTGAPIAGAFVVGHLEVTDRASNYVAVSPYPTDSYGFANLDLMPAGVWRIVVDRAGYRPRVASVPIGVQYGLYYTVSISLPPVQ